MRGSGPYKLFKFLLKKSSPEKACPAAFKRAKQAHRELNRPKWTGDSSEIEEGSDCTDIEADREQERQRIYRASMNESSDYLSDSC